MSSKGKPCDRCGTLITFQKDGLKQDGKIKWKAEKLDASSLYTRVRLNEDGETLYAYTLGGHSCELDLKTGKLISHTSIQ